MIHDAAAVVVVVVVVVVVDIVAVGVVVCRAVAALVGRGVFSFRRFAVWRRSRERRHE